MMLFNASWGPLQAGVSIMSSKWYYKYMYISSESLRKTNLSPLIFTGKWLMYLVQCNFKSLYTCFGFHYLSHTLFSAYIPWSLLLSPNKIVNAPVTTISNCSLYNTRFHRKKGSVMLFWLDIKSIWSQTSCGDRRTSLSPEIQPPPLLLHKREVRPTG